MLRLHSHIDTTLFLHFMKHLVYVMNNVPWELIQLNKLPITRNGLLSGVHILSVVGHIMLRVNIFAAIAINHVLIILIMMMTTAMMVIITMLMKIVMMIMLVVVGGGDGGDGRDLSSATTNYD